MSSDVNCMPHSSSPTSCQPRRHRGHWLLLTVITTIVAVTAARIELLNQQAGAILPAREFTLDGGHARWRQSLATNEARRRELHGPRDPDGQPTSRALMPTEQVEMATSIRRARASNTLLGVVSTWGLAQYLLAPATLILAVPALLDPRIQRRMRLLAATCACVATAAGVLMFYRAYYPSLGW